ncbi:transcriptional regulator, HxlR family [Allosphingosinicella indica]|uniref:Transcriptional regulator, HxlR family n=2 Tax=Allosphingosinicella indica TaxID=941907 RepID=A0A1X7G1P3_9SPHN|nr:transcriptional regulator, HxlR family [Allosphingosinicella indica]
MKLEKMTKGDKSAAKRRYDDACAATHAMDIFGERWALPVMRELMLGPRRFGELKASISGISANVLTQRLESLEEAGVVLRRKLPPPASVQVYELTEWGYQAGPIFQVMGRWGVKSPHHDPARPFSAVSLMLSFRTMMDPALAADVTLSIGFRLSDQQFLFAIDRGQVTIGRDLAGADVVLTGDTATLASAAYMNVPLADLEAEGRIRIEGNRAAAERFVTLFALPDKAA